MNVRIVDLTNKQARDLRLILRLGWHKELFETINGLLPGEASNVATRLMLVNDKWMGLYNPTEMFIDAVRNEGQLTLSQALLNRFQKVLEFEPLARDYPQISESEYLKYVVPLLPSWAPLRIAFNDAGLYSDDLNENLLLQNASRQRN